MILSAYSLTNCSATRWSFEDNGGTPFFSRTLISLTFPSSMMMSNTDSLWSCCTWICIGSCSLEWKKNTNQKYLYMSGIVYIVYPRQSKRLLLCRGSHGVSACLDGSLFIELWESDAKIRKISKRTKKSGKKFGGNGKNAYLCIVKLKVWLSGKLLKPKAENSARGKPWSTLPI